MAIFHEIPVILWTYYRKICNTNLFQICLQVPRKYVSVICSSVAMKGITYFYVASLVFLQAFYSITANSQIFHLIFCLRVCRSKLLQRISRCNDRWELSFCTCHTCTNWAYSLSVNSFFIGNFQIIILQPVFHKGRVAPWNNAFTQNRKAPSSKTMEVLAHILLLFIYSWPVKKCQKKNK